MYFLVFKALLPKMNLKTKEGSYDIVLELLVLVVNFYRFVLSLYN